DKVWRYFLSMQRKNRMTFFVGMICFLFLFGCGRQIDEQTKDNLVKLADYVAKNTIVLGQNLNQINEKLLDSFININRQIAEGLLGHQ
ncbi:MAG: hypothetical protein MJ210_06000, partial [Alphaproteobacteria bacterium]|nr:hypothetical protein [Alphaproteobacteria bacterium]